MSHRSSPLIIAALFVMLSIARASAEPTPVPDVRPDLSAMAMFLGTWNCTSTKSPDGRTVGHVFTTTTTMALDGRWMETDQDTPPFDQYRSRDFVLKSWLTYDAATKMWVNLTVDNLGGYGLTMSPGWNGSRLVTSDVVTSGGQPKGVDTVSRLSDTHYLDHYEVRTPSGTLVNESDCTKAP